MNPTPIEFCDEHDACADGRAFALQYPDMASVWDACERPDWLLWICKRVRPLTKPEDVELAIAFADASAYAAYAAYDAARKEQCDIIRALIPNPFLP